MVALSVCAKVTCGVLPCSVVSTFATFCPSLGSFKSNVKLADSVTVSPGLKSQVAVCMVFGMAVPSSLVLQTYRIVCFTIRAPVGVPNPFPPRNRPFGRVPLPLEGSGAGPLAPPPATAIGGVPKLTGAEGCEPMYCEYARQYSV